MTYHDARNRMAPASTKAVPCVRLADAVRKDSPPILPKGELGKVMEDALNVFVLLHFID